MVLCSNAETFPYMFLKQRLFIEKVELHEDFINVGIDNYSDEYDIQCFIKFDDGDTRSIKMTGFTVNIPKNIKYTFYTFAIVINGIRMYTNKFINKTTSTIY